MDVRIRRATRRDHDVIWTATMQTVWDDLPQDERDQTNRAEFESHFRPHAKKIIESPENEIYVAEDSGGRVLGYTIFGPATSMLSAVPFVFIYDVWVSPGARRQGVATALMDHAVAWCRKQGIGSLKLEVAARNDVARQLYASLEFGEERIFLGRSVGASGGPENDK